MSLIGVPPFGTKVIEYFPSVQYATMGDFWEY